ncbi:hypothetical protein KAH37_09565 [bacterium]|nr:hypothetical protein [bacterium]
MREREYSIGWQNWKEFGSELSAKVTFSLLKECIKLNFSVTEREIVARHIAHNSPVYQDSCVEFFVSFNRKEYYNFEFSCIGTPLAQYGTSRDERIFLSSEVLSKVTVVASLGKEPFALREGSFHWTLDVTLPKALFHFSEIEDFMTQKIVGNFYKCGDNLPQKHYLSAFPIHTKTPDFHRPEFFMELTE